MNTAYKVISLIDYLMNPTKDIEVFGMFGPGNLGDEAMLVAALKSLPENRCIPWRSHPSRPLLNTLVYHRRRKHLLVGGGTLIHGGNTSWLDYVEMRSQQGVKVSFFGTGVAFTPEQISDRSPAYQRWSAVLAQSEEIRLRGAQSVDICRIMGVNAEIFGDFAFLLHSHEMIVSDHKERSNFIGINVGDCLGNQEAFEKTIAVLVKRLSIDFKIIFHIVTAHDIEATRRVILQAGLANERYEVEKHYFDPDAFMRSIRHYRAFIGLKLHAAGLAMIAGVPTLMISYLPKCADFMSCLRECSHMLIDLPLEPRVLESKTEDMLTNPENYVVAGSIAAIAARQRRTLTQVYEPASAHSQ